MKNNILMPILFAVVLLSSSVIAGESLTQITAGPDTYYSSHYPGGAKAAANGDTNGLIMVDMSNPLYPYVTFGTSQWVEDVQVDSSTGEVYYTMADGSGITQIYKYNSGSPVAVTSESHDIGGVTLCPTGTLAYYVLNANWDYDIYRINMDGTGRTALVTGTNDDGSEPDYEGHLSCDSSGNIYYISIDWSNGYNVQKVSSGGVVTDLSTRSWTEVADTQLSPDESILYYTYGNDIWSMSSSDGSSKTQITTGNSDYNTLMCPDSTLYSIRDMGVYYALYSITADAEIASSYNNYAYASCGARAGGGHTVTFTDASGNIWAYENWSEEDAKVVCEYTDEYEKVSITLSDVTMTPSSDKTINAPINPVLRCDQSTPCTSQATYTQDTWIDLAGGEACTAQTAIKQYFAAYINTKSNDMLFGSEIIAGTTKYVAGFDITNNRLITYATNLLTGSIIWADVAVTSDSNVLAFDQNKPELTKIGNSLLTVTTGTNSLGQAGLYSRRFDLLGVPQGEAFNTYGATVTALRLREADCIESCVIAGEAIDSINGVVGVIMHLPSSPPIGSATLIEILGATGECVDAEKTSSNEFIVSCNNNMGLASESFSLLNFPDPATVDLDITTIELITTQAEGAPTRVYDTAVSSNGDVYVAAGYDSVADPAQPILAKYEPQNKNFEKTKKISALWQGLTLDELMELINMDLEFNTIRADRPTFAFDVPDASAYVFTINTDLEIESDVWHFIDYDLKDISDHAVVLQSETNPANGAFATFLPETYMPNMVRTIDFIPSEVSIVPALTDYNGGHDGDYVMYSVGGEQTTPEGFKALEDPLFNASGTSGATNPNGSVKFTTDKQIEIRTFAPDIEIHNFKLKFQCLNGTFDTTTGSCDSCCEYDLGNGTCQAEIEKVWAMFPTVNVSMTLSTSSPLNITALSLVCREFTSSLWPAGCSALSPHGFGASNWMTWTGSSISTVIPTNAGVVINLTGSNVYPNITIPLGTASINNTVQQIGCEVNGTWAIGDTQNFTINKTMTITAN